MITTTCEIILTLTIHMYSRNIHLKIDENISSLFVRVVTAVIGAAAAAIATAAVTAADFRKCLST